MGRSLLSRTLTIANCGLRIAQWAIRNPNFEIRNLAASLLSLTFCFGLIPVAPAQTAGQPQPIEPKLPPVRCTIAPTKDAVRWRAKTPVAPVAEKDKSTQRGELQTPDSGDQLPASDPKPKAPKTERNETRLTDTRLTDTRLTDPAFAGSVSPYPPHPANTERQTSTDKWFQIPREDSETTDIQAALTPPADDSQLNGPQPLAQVLADLARRAQRNFVDPGIPVTETITYNFTDSDLDPWEAFTRIAQTRGYRIVCRDDIVTLARDQQEPLNPENPHAVKAEIWVWLDQTSKPGTDLSELLIQAAGADVAPNNKPQTVRSLEPGSKATISLFDVHSERGDSTLCLTVNANPLPNGHIQADLRIENAAPCSDGHKSVTIRRAVDRTVELTPTKQVIQIDGVLVPNSPVANKQSWIQRWFRKRATGPATTTARMVVKLTPEPVAGSDTPLRIDNPVHRPGLDSGKTGIVLAPSKDRRTPELTSTQTAKRGTP